MAMLGYYLHHLLRHGRIDPVEYFVSERFGVVYIENAKVACTAIKQVLFPEFDHAALGQDEFHRQLRQNASLVPPEGKAADFVHFSFFRDPLTRLESCYRDKIVRPADEETVYRLRFHRALFGLFGGVDIARPDIGWAEFADAVARLPDRLRDRHIMSQAPAFRAVVGAPHHFIGRHEAIAADWAELSARTGMPPLPRLNSSGPAQPAGQQPQMPPLPPLTLARLRKAYRADFALLEARL